jgi:hypothetical protein
VPYYCCCLYTLLAPYYRCCLIPCWHLTIAVAFIPCWRLTIAAALHLAGAFAIAVAFLSPLPCCCCCLANADNEGNGNNGSSSEGSSSEVKIVETLLPRSRRIIQPRRQNPAPKVSRPATRATTRLAPAIVAPANSEPRAKRRRRA